MHELEQTAQVATAYNLAKNSSLRKPSLKENLEDQLDRSKQETARLEELISLLEANRDTQRIIELLGREY